MQQKTLKIITELNLSLSDVGKILDISWQSVQKKKSLINGNKFTQKDFELLDKYRKRKIKNLEKI